MVGKAVSRTRTGDAERSVAERGRRSWYLEKRRSGRSCLTARDQLTVVSEVIRRATGSQAFVDERSQLERDALSHRQPVKRLEDRRLGVMCSARRVPVTSRTAAF